MTLCFKTKQCLPVVSDHSVLDTQLKQNKADANTETREEEEEQSAC